MKSIFRSINHAYLFRQKYIKILVVMMVNHDDYRETKTHQNARRFGSSMAERQRFGCLDNWPYNCKQIPSLRFPIDRFHLDQSSPSPFSSVSKHAHSLPFFSYHAVGKNDLPKRLSHSSNGIGNTAPLFIYQAVGVLSLKISLMYVYDL